MKRIGLYVLMAGLLLACARATPFYKERWLVKDDIGGYRWRAEMLDDLEKSHELDGRRSGEVFDLLGAPDFAEGNERLWTITIDYGMDIDPV